MKLLKNWILNYVFLNKVEEGPIKYHLLQWPKSQLTCLEKLAHKIGKYLIFSSKHTIRESFTDLSHTKFFSSSLDYNGAKAKHRAIQKSNKITQICNSKKLWSSSQTWSFWLYFFWYRSNQTYYQWKH